MDAFPSEYSTYETYQPDIPEEVQEAIQIPSVSYEQSWQPKVSARIKKYFERFEEESMSAAMNASVASVGSHKNNTSTSCTSQEYIRPYMVALVGMPGSGKSTSAMLLAHELEKSDIQVCIMPHDGYHWPIDYLRTFPDSEDAIYRRGAPDTFDPHSLLRDLKRIRDSDEMVVTVPAFDHAKGDPEPDKHVFDRRQHQVVICEGLYLMHDRDGWEEIGGMFDLKLFINSDLELCMDRVKIRNQCIPGYTPEEIIERTDKVDRINAMTVIASAKRADFIIRSSGPAAPHIGSEDISVLEEEKKDDSSLVVVTKNITDSPYIDPPVSVIKMQVFDDEFAAYQTYQPELPDGLEEVFGAMPEAHYDETWEPKVADQIKKKFEESDEGVSKGRPYMVGLVGMPGSGKSTSVMLLANELEKAGINVCIMPHDGYHWPMEYLKSFPDAEDVIYRRGAPDTFDPRGLIRDLHRIRDGDEQIVMVPAFDHARGDPEPDKHIFDRHQHQVVICEGLYLLHDKDGWEEVADMFDLKIFMKSDLELCMDRVKIRNVCIPGYTPEEIIIRTDKVDRVNALTVMASAARADMVVESVAK